MYYRRHFSLKYSKHAASLEFDTAVSWFVEFTLSLIAAVERFCGFNVSNMHMCIDTGYGCITYTLCTVKIGRTYMRCCLTVCFVIFIFFAKGSELHQG